MLLPPLILFACMHVILWYSAHETGTEYAKASSFAHWDSGIYLQIAQNGYHLTPCGPNNDKVSPTDLCGNTAWFPGYPWSIRGLSWLMHLPPNTSGFLIAAVFCFADLMLLWNWFFGVSLTWANLLAFAMAGFFPGNVYYSAVFPVSMFLFFVLVSLRMLLRRQWVLSGIAGGVAAFTYSTGFLLAPIAGLSILLNELLRPGRPCEGSTGNEPQANVFSRSVAGAWRPLWWAAETAGLISLGFVSVLAVHYYAVGHWNAFFLAEKKFHHSMNNPFHTWLVETHPYIQGTLWPPQAYSPIAGLQSIFVLLLVVVLLVFAFRSRMRSPVDVYLSIYLVGYWLLPLIAGGFVSLYRAEALLFPTAVLARHLPPAALAVLVAFCIVLTLGMDPLFFRNWLV